MTDPDRAAPFRFVVDGHRKLEDVPLREVAALLDAFAGLVARGSAEILHRPLHSGPGRQEGPIEDAARVRLISLTSGSIVADLLPAAPTPLPQGGLDHGVETLSEQAIGLIIDIADGAIDGHAGLAKALLDFTERHVLRYGDAVLTLEDGRPGRERRVSLDAPRRAQLVERIGGSTAAAATKDVTGRLFEANLEARSGQVRTPTGEKVSVEYEPEHETAIKGLLGDRAALRGEIIYDARTQRAKAVRITQIDAGTQLDLDFGDVDFWTDRPATELAAEAGARPVDDPSELEIGDVTQEEWSALYEALGIGR